MPDAKPKTAPKRKPITPGQMEDAARLRALFAKRQPKLSQEKFAADYGLGTQGNLWQYLHGHVPLNIKALLRFARGLKVEPEDISPELAKELGAAAARVPMFQQSLPIYGTSPERQARLLELFDKLRIEQQDEMLQELYAAARTNEAIVRELGPRFKIASDEKVGNHIKPAGPVEPTRPRASHPRKIKDK